MELSLARLHFYQALQPDVINLAEAALYIAQEEYPQLEVASYLTMLDQMAAQVQLPSDRYPLKIIQAINRLLYEELGFSGNSQDYYDPRNSFLNDVLNRRTGIPITLSLIYLEIAQRLDFPMIGVGFPGHFLIRPDLEEIGIYVDCFERGEILFEQDCQARLQQLYELYGAEVKLEPRFFNPINPRQFLVRMLTNLKQIYLNQGEIGKCLAVVERILLVTPEALMELRDRGVLFYHLGCWNEARQDLNRYLLSDPDREDQAMIQNLLKKMDDQ
ncbi:MAG: transglutaminase-like domain-containing protein [Aphanocapsa sp. GSE-SYN-MK-11-07L]|jgi:regulator of sirC expression with transglutaminase-like and TPR domain|nr:transglutaminase-like domain-containing protein [Aphanocapsa sp. GSE-SYN-MK-11-07L]